MTPYQRARQPDQKAERRQAILAAAAALFDAEGPNGTGLNAIAARAGFTKSNLYRYFESREEVLLNLFIEDFDAYATALETSLAALPKGDVAAVARAMTAAFMAHPRFCTLTSMLAAVLEQNVSETVIMNVKRSMAAMLQRAAGAVHNALPEIVVEDCGWVVSMAGVIVAGIWPSTSPTAAACKVLELPEFALMKPAADRDIERAVLLLLRGLA